MATEVRVAVVQLAFHPVSGFGGRALLGDTTASPSPRSSLPAVDALIAGLEQRIREVHLEQLRARLTAILAACGRLSVKLLVLPPDAVPPEILSTVTFRHTLGVVASSHVVSERMLADDAYGHLKMHGNQPSKWLGRTIAPYVSRQRLIAAQPALRGHEETWRPLREGTGVLFASDIVDDVTWQRQIVPGLVEWQRQIVPGLAKCPLLAVLDDVPGALQPRLRASLAEQAKLRAVLLASPAATGGSCVLAGDLSPAMPGELHIDALAPGEEGLLIYDVRVPTDDEPSEPAAATLALVAAASLVYRDDPIADAYAEWSTRFQNAEAGMFRLEREPDIRPRLLDIERSRELLARASELPDSPTRARRLRQLLEQYPRITRSRALQTLTCEVVMPDACLPQPVLRRVIELSAARQIDLWRRDLPADTWREVAGRFNHLLSSRSAAADDWSDRGQTAIRAIERRIVQLARVPSLVTRAEDDGGPPVPAEYVYDDVKLRLDVVGDRTGVLYEASLWLELAGAVDLRAVSVADRHRIHSLLLGRVDERWHLWSLTDIDDVSLDRVVAALTALDLGVDAPSCAHLDLVAQRRRLPEFLRTYEGVHRRAVAERARHLSDLHSVSERLFATREGHGRTPALELLDAWLASNERVALLLGPGGSGKSTLVAEWTARRWETAEHPLPIPFRVSSAWKDQDPWATLLHQLGRPAHERAALELLLWHDRIVLCADGFESVEPPLRGALVRSLVSLAARGRLLVVSRWDDLAERVEGFESTPEFKIRLESLSSAQVESVVTRVLRKSGDPRDALRRISGIYDLADLTRQPLLLGMVLQTLDRLDPTAHLEPIDIFEAYCRRWLDDVRRGDGALGDEAALGFVDALALTLWHQHADTCTLADLRATPWRALAASPPPLLEPFLVVEDDVHRFAHQSFFEFFLARALVEHVPTYPDELLAAGLPAPAVLEFIVPWVRRMAGDPAHSRFVAALRTWLSAGPTRDRKGYSAGAGAAAVYLHAIGRRFDATRQWIPYGADLTGAILTHQDLRGIKLAEVDLASADLSDTDLAGSDLRAASLVNAYLNEARLAGADLRNVDARAARLHHASADRCDLRGADLSGAYLSGSCWTECQWDGARLDTVSDGAWLNLGGTGTTLGQPLPRQWRLTASSGRLDFGLGIRRGSWGPAWSPNGRFLAFGTPSRTGILDCRDGAVHFLGGQTRVFRWAPCGRRFAYIETQGASTTRVGALGEGGEPPISTPLELSGRLAFALDWRPADGRLVVVTMQGVEVEGDGAGEWSLVVPLTLPDDPDDRKYPAIEWSVNGSILLRDFAGTLLYLRDLGDRPQSLADGPYNESLAPSGEFLVLQRLLRRLELVDLRGPEPAAFVLDEEDATALAWQPNGNILSYSRKPGVLGLYDAERRRIIDERWLARSDCEALAWSPDGERLAFVSRETCLRVEHANGDVLLELIVTDDEHAVSTPNGWIALSAPDVRRIWLFGSIDRTTHTFPLAGLRRVLDDRALVRRTLQGEPDLPTAEQRLDALGWHTAPTGAGAPRVRPPRAPNRFRPGAPLDDPDLPGREDILSELATLIEGRAPAVLKGPRRAGKTSILHALEARHRGERLVLRRTLESHPLRTPDEFAVFLDPALAGQPAPADALLRRLQAERTTPLLLLDELAWLGRADDKLFAWLRWLGQEGLAAFVLSGSHSDWIELMQRANQTPGSSFGNDYTIVELGPLTEERAIRFLVDTAPEDVPIDERQTAAWIVELCGGWPFYLQVMGYALVQEARGGRRDALVDKHELFELYERRLLVDRDAVFRGRWSDLRRPAQEILLAELQRARQTRHNELTPPRELSRTQRKILGDADLIDVRSGWKIDRPLRDWLHRNLDELEPHDVQTL